MKIYALGKKILFVMNQRKVHLINFLLNANFLNPHSCLFDLNRRILRSHYTNSHYTLIQLFHKRCIQRKSIIKLQSIPFQRPRSDPGRLISWKLRPPGGRGPPRLSQRGLRPPLDFLALPTRTCPVLDDPRPSMTP